MNSTITINQAQPRTTTKSVTSIMRKQINKMKVGYYFEVTGVDAKLVGNIRSTLSAASKKDGFRISTRFSGSKLTVERIRKNS